MSYVVIYCPSCGLHWLFVGGVRGARALCTACEKLCEVCTDSARCPQARMHGIADMANAVSLVRGKRK